MVATNLNLPGISSQHWGGLAMGVGMAMRVRVAVVLAVGMGMAVVVAVGVGVRVILALRVLLLAFSMIMPAVIAMLMVVIVGVPVGMGVPVAMGVGVPVIIMAVRMGVGVGVGVGVVGIIAVLIGVGGPVLGVGDAVEVPVANIAAKASFATPVFVGDNCHLAGFVSRGVVNVEAKGLVNRLLHQLSKGGLIMQDGVRGGNDVVSVCLEVGLFSRRIGIDRQDVPHIIRGSLKRAEANSRPQEPNTSPVISGHNFCLPHFLGLAIVNGQLALLIHTGLHLVHQGGVLLVQSDSINSDQIIKKWLQSCLLCRRVFLDHQHMETL